MPGPIIFSHVALVSFLPRVVSQSRTTLALRGGGCNGYDPHSCGSRWSLMVRSSRVVSDLVLFMISISLAFQCAIARPIWTSLEGVALAGSSSCRMTTGVSSLFMTTGAGSW